MLSKLLFFLVSPAGSSVPGETAAEEGGSGVAVPGELSVGPSPSAAVEGGSCRTDSGSSAILLGSGDLVCAVGGLCAAGRL